MRSDNQALTNTTTRLPGLPESERALLGYVLSSDPDTQEHVLSQLSQEEFLGESHQKLFRAIRSLSEESLSINHISAMERSGVGREFTDRVLACGLDVNKGQAKTFLADLRRVSVLRKITLACSTATSQVTNDAKVEQILEGLERGLFSLDGSGISEAEDAQDTAHRVIRDFMDRYNSGGGPQISSGLRELDRAIIGLRPGKNFVVGARPSAGKSALMGTLTKSVLRQTPPLPWTAYGVVTFSLEMSREEVVERALADESDVNLRKLISAKDMTPEEMTRLVGAADAFKAGRWKVEDQTYGIGAMRRKARIIASKMKRNSIKLALVVVDYLQLAGEIGEGREQQVSAVSRGCKLMAKELDCTVLALSQLNRSCESRDDKRPLLSDLRESGSIEQDADIVAFIYRENMYNKAAPDDEAEIIIRKQRSGPIGTCYVKFNGRLVRFEDGDSGHAERFGGDAPGPKLGISPQINHHASGGQGED